jgi:ABC-type multidrug transport system permease subunit
VVHIARSGGGRRRATRAAQAGPRKRDPGAIGWQARSSGGSTVEVVTQLSSTVIFPLTFLSNIFVPPGTLPRWLQPVAEWNPASTLTAATRQLWGNPNPFASTGFPAEHPILLTLIWTAVIVAIFAPLAIHRYRSLSR